MATKQYCAVLYGGLSGPLIEMCVLVDTINYVLKPAHVLLFQISVSLDAQQFGHDGIHGSMMKERVVYY